MADSRDALHFWLDSINLGQYYTTFCESGYVSKHQCQGLQDEQLTAIGISLPGHRKRILTHLPTDNTWLELENAAVKMSTDNQASQQPQLPKKKKSLRESFLYQDASQLGFNDRRSRSSVMDGVTAVNAGGDVARDGGSVTRDADYINLPVEGATAAPKASPRPVPRPRTKKSPIEETKPFPSKRPTPAPRSRVSMYRCSESDDHDIANDQTIPKKSVEIKDTFQITSSDTLQLKDACTEETSTDAGDVSDVYSVPRDVSYLYSVPDKSKSPSGDHTTSDSTSIIDHSNGVRADSIYQNISEDNVESLHHAELEQDELYVNEGFFKEAFKMPERKSDTERPLTHLEGKLDIVEGCAEDLESSFENANFDPVSKAYKLKQDGISDTAECGGDSFEQQPFPDFDFKFRSEDTISPKTPDVAPIPCISLDQEQVTEESDDVYEAIWVKKETTQRSSNSSNSSNQKPEQTMDLSLFMNNSEFDGSPLTSMNSVGSRTSFNLPPPQFSPPPLPNNPSVMTDIISSFDPLIDSPTIPPRPIPSSTVSVATKSFKPYENVPFSLSTTSVTLPGHHNMEPDMPAQSQPIRQQLDQSQPIRQQLESPMITVDPFQHVDPFDSFKPDTDDGFYDTAGIPGDTSDTSTPLDNMSTPVPAARPDKGDNWMDKGDNWMDKGDTWANFDSVAGGGSAIYEPAEDVGSFDPFGLNAEAKLSRSISDTSTGSHQLSAVPPAPKWNETTDEDRCRYSLAANFMTDSPGDYENPLERSMSMDNVYMATLAITGGLDEDLNARPEHEDLNARPNHEDPSARPDHEDPSARPNHEDLGSRPSNFEIIYARSDHEDLGARSSNYENVFARPNHEDPGARPDHEDLGARPSNYENVFGRPDNEDPGARPNHEDLGARPSNYENVFGRPSNYENFNMDFRNRHFSIDLYDSDSSVSGSENSVFMHDGDTDSNGSIDDYLDRAGADTEEPSTMTPVEILPTAAMSPRRREKSGYLYKQGGVKRNRGWRKRWVIFDGNSLRYYASAKDQVSKRVVPLSCMVDVKMDVKGSPWHFAPSDMLVNSCRRLTRAQSEPVINPNNPKQFKFKLQCTNRTFLFAIENLDDCKMWSSTLLEAIITYKKPEGGEVAGGDMAHPDLASWIKLNKNRYKFYVVLKKHKLAYYQNIDDYNMSSPIHEIEMKLSSIKELDRTRLQLYTHYDQFIMHFESSSDASNWRMAIEESIMDALGDNTVLDQVKENPANGVCADCGAKVAHWASMNLGIVLCLKCAGIHRGFNTQLSRIRSLRMDSRVWNSSLIEMFKVVGNVHANRFWLKNRPSGMTINEHTLPDKRKKYIYDKYMDKKFCDKHPAASNQKQLNEALLEAARSDDVLLTMQVLLSGAEVLYSRPGEPNISAFELAKEAHQRIQMEFILQNGGDRTKNFMPGSEEESLVAKLRAEVQHQGYLYKTGSDLKGFLKRWCVLEHGHLSYYDSEESKVEKDRIDNSCILCIQSSSRGDRYPWCFEISSNKNGNRVYLFSASSAEERLQWIRVIAQVFCPVSLMDSMKIQEFCVAGYANLKTGFSKEWQKSWYMLENRRLYYTDKGQQDQAVDSIDLRKVTSITHITPGTPDAYFVLSMPDRALYFQAELPRDTERMFSALEGPVKRGGDVLEDQVLNMEDVPVFISQCVNFIEQNGMRTRGIYRQAAQDSKVQALMDRFHEDARSVVLRMEEHTVDEVCNALKRYLRYLSDPLLTADLYKRWTVTAAIDDHDIKLQWYKYLLQQLPRCNYVTLKCLATHLNKLSNYSNESLMTINNISIAFGSTLMKSAKTETDVPTEASVGNNMQLEMKVVSDIVEYYIWLFDIKETDDDKSKQDRIESAMERLERLAADPRQSTVPADDMIIWVYKDNTKSNAESVRIKKSTTVAEVMVMLAHKMRLQQPDKWALHEVIKANELERPLDASVKLWPLMLEWQNWSTEYCSTVSLNIKSSDALKNKIERAFEPGKALFAEMKYAVEKKFKKMAFEFTHSKLSCYKDLKNVNNPTGSWNIEDLSLYIGADARRSTPTNWAFTFLCKGEKVGEKDLPYFGRTVCCSSEQERLHWISAMMKAQYPAG